MNTYFEKSINTPITDGNISAYSILFTPILQQNLLYMLQNSSQQTINSYNLDYTAYQTYGDYTPWKVCAWINGILSIDQQFTNTYYIIDASTLADVYSEIDTTPQMITTVPLQHPTQYDPQILSNFTYLQKIVQVALAST